MTARPISVILIVVGTLSAVCVLYAGTLAICAIRGIAPPDGVFTYFKDFALVALGGLGSLLARTSTEAGSGTEQNPLSTQIVSTPKNPVHVTEDKKAK